MTKSARVAANAKLEFKLAWRKFRFSCFCIFEFVKICISIFSNLRKYVFSNWSSDELLVTCTSAKGGVGKTTSSIHIAAYLSAKDSTLLIDGDPNHSAMKWARRGQLPFQVVDLMAAPKHTRNVEHIVFDTPARPNRDDLEALARSWSRASHAPARSAPSPLPPQASPRAFLLEARLDSTAPPPPLPSRTDPHDPLNPRDF